MLLTLSQRIYFGFLAVAGLGGTVLGATGQLRVATYNIEADIGGYTTPRPGLYTAIEAMGAASTSVSAARPVDILSLQETTSNATTVTPIVTALNTYYAGSAVYASPTLQGTETGNSPTVGNGPNALVYNTSTLTLLQAVGIGTPNGSSNGEYRQIVRYEFQPKSGTAADNFYVYVEHYKSGAVTKSDSSDGDARTGEAQILRADSATLGANAHIIYTGDFNVDPVEAASATTGESTFNVLESTATTGGAIDPLNNIGQGTKSSYTDSSTDLSYRDDYELQTSPTMNDATGLKYIAGSYKVFGNDSGTLNSTQNSYLSTASDHLPVFADYTYVLAPEPALLALGASGLWILRRRRWA